MFTIFKYHLPIESQNAAVRMPRGAQILKIDRQRIPGNIHAIFIWALIDPKAEKEVRHFRVGGTGHPMESKDYARMRHLETVTRSGASPTFHIFEIFKRDKPGYDEGPTGANGPG